MKDLIKKILKEETSGLSDTEKNAAYKLMNHITKGYQWYTTPSSIWLINPKTKEWMLEFQKVGYLFYHNKTPDRFSKYLNMEETDFKSFIKLWVEDVFKRTVVATALQRWSRGESVEDALNNGKQLK